MKVTCPLIISVLFSTLLTIAYAQEPAQEIAPDGAWCWYSDPRAVYHKGDQKKIYFGFINSAGDVVMASREVKKGTTKQFILHEKLQIDDHNVPSILFLPDGKLLTFYTEHNGKFFMRKSEHPEDITAWETERELTFGLKDILITYSHPIMLSEENNRIYVFFRGRNKRKTEDPKYVNWRQFYAYSDDEGETWSDAKPYLSTEGDYNQIPYLKVTSDHQSKIHFLFTDGHPKLGACSIYHMYYEDGSFHQSDGTEIAPIGAGRIPFEQVDKIYDPDSTGVKSWVWDIALDRSGNPVIAYALYPSVQDHIYYYGRWNGSEWERKKIVNSGSHITHPEKNGKVLEEHYSGGVVLDAKRPENIYLSRQVNEVFEIEHWTLKKGEWVSTPLTQASENDNVRPYVVYDSPGKHPAVIWMNGRYEHYIRYDTRLMMGKGKR